MITRKALAATHVPARHGDRRRAAVPGCDGSGVRREPPRQAAGPHGVRLRAERHRHAQLESRLRGQARRAAAHPEAAGAVQGRHPAARQPDAQHRPRAARWRRRSRPLLRRVPDRHAGQEDAPSTSRRASPWTRSSPTRSARQTRFPSLEVGLEDARQAGDCDSGYSCAYTNNLAWRSETQPLPPILDPRALFERLFGNGVALSPEARARQAQVPPQHPRFRHRRHQEAARRTSARPIKRKLDEYLSSIREIERQIEKAEKDNAQIDPHMDKPYGVPADFAEHFKLMTDMMTIAFQADLTRVLTFLVTREGTSRAYREIGIPDGHHPLTHHRNEPS